jgi:hypothetical protein
MVCLAIQLTRPPPTPVLIHLHLVPLRHQSPQSAYAARHLPCLHTFHRLILCPTCGQGHHPVSQFGSELLLLTSHWHPYRRRIDILFTDLRIHPSGLASSSAPSSHLYIEFLCLLADPLGFEDLPPGVSIEARTGCWLDILAVMACFFCCVCPTPSPLTPPLYHAPIFCTPSSADSNTTIMMDSLDCSHASASTFCDPKL